MRARGERGCTLEFRAQNPGFHGFVKHKEHNNKHLKCTHFSNAYRGTWEKTCKKTFIRVDEMGPG